MPPLIRKATAEDVVRIGAIARAAYGKYVPRIGREPAPMVADFAAEVAAGRVVVIGRAAADRSCRRRGQAPSLVGGTALHQRSDDGEFVHVRAHGLCRNPSGGREGFRPGLSALDSSRR